MSEKPSTRLGGGGPSGEGPAPHRPDGPSTSQTPHPRAADQDTVRDTPATAEEQQQQVERDLGDLLADVERERDEYLELAKRTKADFENYRKRVAGEATEAEKRGRAALATDLLPVLDNLDRALRAAESPEGASSHLTEGVRLVREELEGALKRSGVESYEPAGEPFDPHLHEAMMTRPAGEDAAGMVLEVLQKGYRLDGRVLRPARVIVGSEENGPVENRPSGGEPPDGVENGPSAGKPADGVEHRPSAGKPADGFEAG